MSDKMKNVWEAALTLTVEERAELAGRLLETLDENDPNADHVEIDAAQNAEIMRRSEQIDRGTATMIPGDEAMRLFSRTEESMKLTFHRDALNEMIDAANFYESKRAGLSRRFDAAVEAAFQTILRDPAMWAKRAGGVVDSGERGAKLG